MSRQSDGSARLPRALGHWRCGLQLGRQVTRMHVYESLALGVNVRICRSESAFVWLLVGRGLVRARRRERRWPAGCEK